eukprot:TRINITY_DN3738_c0_g2_i1.p1 TRINITY_DN3738_c0_g2~~TRINITY_DN3738_c0_g2_i1.p1  ORF type:complete len:458 (-),score=136.12 TRINITY_DN3738_c0_g2_i1:157-1530(-)
MFSQALLNTISLMNDSYLRWSEKEFSFCVKRPLNWLSNERSNYKHLILLFFDDNDQYFDKYYLKTWSKLCDLIRASGSQIYGICRNTQQHAVQLKIFYDLGFDIIGDPTSIFASYIDDQYSDYNSNNKQTTTTTVMNEDEEKLNTSVVWLSKSNSSSSSSSSAAAGAAAANSAGKFVILDSMKPNQYPDPFDIWSDITTNEKSKKERNISLGCPLTNVGWKNHKTTWDSLQTNNGGSSSSSTAFDLQIVNRRILIIDDYNKLNKKKQSWNLYGGGGGGVNYNNNNSTYSDSMSPPLIVKRSESSKKKLKFGKKFKSSNELPSIPVLSSSSSGTSPVPSRKASPVLSRKAFSKKKGDNNTEVEILNQKLYAKDLELKAREKEIESNRLHIQSKSVEIKALQLQIQMMASELEEYKTNNERSTNRLESAIQTIRNLKQRLGVELHDDDDEVVGDYNDTH